ncbi:MAG: hypothetical protein QOJ65_2493, partial [Fimbriimonadaceae bacterium]|nr:hypothetical protein [Fimbriimonadaceae bacterium]
MIGWRILLWAVLVLTALLFLYLVRGILPPFIIAFIIASLLEPAIRKLRLRGMSRRLAVGIVTTVFFVGVLGIGFLIGPKVGSQVSELQNSVTTVVSNLEQGTQNDNFFVRWRPSLQTQAKAGPGPVDRILSPFRGVLDRLGVPSTQAAVMKQYLPPLRKNLAPLIENAVGSFLGILKYVPELLLQLILIPILVVMMLMDMEDLKRRAPKYIPPALRTSTMRLFEDIGDVFTRYLRGVASVTLLYMVCAALLFLAMGVPYAILVAIGFSALYLIPYIGNVIAYFILFLLVGLSGTTGYFLHFSNPWVYAVLVTIM